jgi:hypothetical protein
MAGFEDELEQAARARTAATATGQAAFEHVRRANAAARVEAAARLDRLGGAVSAFLSKHGVPPVQMMAGVKSTFRPQRLVTLCSGWWIHPFLTTGGKFVDFTPSGRISFGGDPLRGRIKPGQQYLGRFNEAKGVVRPYERGLAGAMFIDSTERPHFTSGAEFNAFYYKDLYQPLAELPTVYEALLLPGDDSKLYLASLDTESHRHTITAMHERLQASALQLLDKQR